MTVPQYVLTTHAQARIASRNIKIEWIERTLAFPEMLELDLEDITKTHAFKAIPEFGGKILRVVYNGTANPWIIISAYFDRRRRTHA
jgi:hypothetical protein